jgi:hypothetical protein
VAGGFDPVAAGVIFEDQALLAVLRIGPSLREITVPYWA